MIQVVVIACLWFGTPCEYPQDLSAAPLTIDTSVSLIAKPVIEKKPPPVFTGMGSNVEQWRGLVQSYFGDQTENALCVMLYESGGNPNAISPTTDYGLMQIHAPLWAEPYGVSYQDLLDPNTNMSIAKSIWDTYGWSAWSAWSKC